MNTIVPLISSGVAGPLGVLHLPRLWLKLSLESVGKLAPGYPGAGTGYDVLVWLEEAVATRSFPPPPEITVHSANAGARPKMEAAIASIRRFVERR